MPINTRDIEINTRKLSQEIIEKLESQVDKTKPIKYYGLINEYEGKYSDNPKQMGYSRIQIHAHGKKHAAIILKKVEEDRKMYIYENTIDGIMEMYDDDNISFDSYDEFISDLSNELVSRIFKQDEANTYLVKVQPYT